MSPRIPVSLSVVGPLDTYNPKRGLAPGVLLEAQNVAHRWWGPRLGHKMTTRPGSLSFGPGSTTLDFLSLLHGGTGERIKGGIQAGQQLGDYWTLDIILRVTYPWEAGSEIFAFGNLGNTDLVVNSALTGDTNRITVFVGGTGTGSSLTSTDAAFASASLTKVLHLRIWRTGSSLEMIFNGVSQGTLTGLYTQPDGWDPADSYTPAPSYGGWMIGGLSGTFSGEVHSITLRRNTQQFSGSGHIVPLNPRAGDVLLAVLGARWMTGTGGLYVIDYSKWRAHGLVYGTISTFTHAGAPYLVPVQGAGYVSSKGVGYDKVLAGGILYTRGKHVGGQA